MNLDKIRSLAGLPSTSVTLTESDKRLFAVLNEVVVIPDDITFDQLIERLDACKRALGIASRMKGEDRKKWVSATFVNLNKLTAAVKRMLKDAAVDDNFTGNKDAK